MPSVVGATQRGLSETRTDAQWRFHAQWEIIIIITSKVSSEVTVQQRGDDDDENSTAARHW